MKTNRYFFVIMLLFIPCYVFAHGEEALFVLLLPIISGMVFILALNFLQLSPASKKILIFIYGLALLLTLVITMGWSFSDNGDVINLLITLVAPVAALIGYFIIKRKEKALRKKKAASFLDKKES